MQDKYCLIGQYRNLLEPNRKAIMIIKQKELEFIKDNEKLKEKWKITLDNFI